MSESHILIPDHTERFQGARVTTIMKFRCIEFKLLSSDGEEARLPSRLRATDGTDHSWSLHRVRDPGMPPKFPLISFIR